MIRHTLAAVLILSFVGLTHAWGEQPLAFTGVTVIPMDEERTLEDHTVLIEDGQIAQIAPADELDVPDEAQVIDGEGRYLMPGLAEMHAHVPAGNPQYRDDVMFLYLANGITLARGMLGHPEHLPVRDQLARGEILGPRLVTAGPGFTAGNVASPAQGVHEVRAQDEAGYDFLKIFGGFSVDAFDALAQAADASNIPMAGHVPGNVGLDAALDAGYATIDHFDAYMPALVDPEETEGVNGGFFGYRLAPHAQQQRIEEVAERTREAGTWVVPTETIFYSAFDVDLDTVREDRPEFQYMPQSEVDGWIDWVTNFRSGGDYDQDAGDTFLQVRLDLLQAMHDADAGILLGSDAPQWFNVPGFSVHREMQVMTDAGLSPYDVLETGTVNPAVYLEEENVFGRVAEGLRADLVLLEANPLDDIANTREIAGVVRHGRWLSREQIDDRLSEIADRHAD